MNSKNMHRALRLLALSLLLAQSVEAIKIVVPDQYKDQVEAINQAEQAERRSELEGVAESAEGGIQIAGEEKPTPEKAAVDTDEFLVQSVVEANETAAAFEGTLAADEGLVSGQIVDKESGAPLSGVAIIIEGTDVATVTAEDGRYSLGPTTAGTFTISFIKSGYIEANVTDYNIAGGEISVFPFALPPRPAEMSDEVYELQDFTVTAEEANNLMMKLELQMNSDNLLSALSSEDFSKFAASDLGDAIKRVSGVSVVGGKYAVIRGLGDRYVNSTLNGLPIASPDPDRQAVQLDLFPSGLFEALEVTKTYTPDQSAFSTGGINMKIRDLPEEFFATLSSGIGGHSIATGNDDFLTSGRVTSQDRWANGAEERGIPDAAKDFPEDLNKPVFPIPGITPGPPFITQAQKDAAVAEASAITDLLGRNMHAFEDAPEVDHSFKFSAGDSRLFYKDRVRFGIIGGSTTAEKPEWSRTRIFSVEPPRFQE